MTWVDRMHLAAALAVVHAEARLVECSTRESREEPDLGEIYQALHRVELLIERKE